jgi:unsaturated rhamnogalacturonyl hydrolase
MSGKKTIMKSIKISLIVTIVLSCICTNGSSQKTVILDNYFNNEYNSQSGLPFHYLWEDTLMSGFSQFGAIFRKEGFKLSTLKEKPSIEKLNDASIYIIVDPDNRLETTKPNFMDSKAANIISNWVKKGGVLLMLTNDSQHCELDSFNILADKFGMRFTNLILHPEKFETGKPRNFNSCASINLPDHLLFKGVSKMFLKEIASIECRNLARPILIEQGKVLMAEAKFGKGYVFAVGDPLFYNEYIDHFMLPSDFDNLKAAKNLVKLLKTK